MTLNNGFLLKLVLARFKRGACRNDNVEDRLLSLLLSLLVSVEGGFFGCGPLAALYYYSIKTCFLSKFFCLHTGAAAPFGCGTSPLYEIS